MTDELQQDLERRQSMRLHYGFAVAVVIMVMAFTTYFVLQREDVQKSYLYPYPYKEVVLKYSARYGVDSDLVAAVIKTESRFKAEAESERGALGLMQLMPSTASWISSRLEDGMAERGMSHNTLSEPEINVKYGTWYLSSLMVEFDGNEILALAAYNAGSGNVHSWVEEYGWDDDFKDISAIPFGETREYVRSVLKNKVKYRALYER